jgi:hypothetical protein
MLQPKSPAAYASLSLMPKGRDLVSLFFIKSSLVIGLINKQILLLLYVKKKKLSRGFIIFNKKCSKVTFSIKKPLKNQEGY